MNVDIFNALEIRDRIEVLHLLQGIKGARQIAFQAHVALNEDDPDLGIIYRDLEAMYEKMAALVEAPVEPVFDSRTYIPNPDRCR